MLDVLWLTAVTACLFNGGVGHGFSGSVLPLLPSLSTNPSSFSWMNSQAQGSKVRGRSRRDCSRADCAKDISGGNMPILGFQGFLFIKNLAFRFL